MKMGICTVVLNKEYIRFRIDLNEAMKNKVINDDNSNVVEIHESD